MNAQPAAGKQSLPAWRQLPRPLHERPAAHVCQLTDLRDWYRCARDAAMATADAFAADHGPTSQELQVILMFLT